MSYYVMDVKDQLIIANRLKLLELCLKYPEQEDRIKEEYLNLKRRLRSDAE